MFWNSTHDYTVDLSDTKFYGEYDNVKPTTPEGYRCDPLERSPIIFLGSCDMSGPLPIDAVWSRIMHQEITKIIGPFPYIGLSRVHGGCTSVIRRLHGYCRTYGAPEKVFAVLPRPVTIEVYVRGRLINVSEREMYLSYLAHVGKLTASEFNRCMKAVEFNRSQQDNAEHQLYQFELIASFLQLICERFNIDFRWTPNVGAGAIDYYDRWLDLFLLHNPWMAQTCAGVAEAVDFSMDYSAGLKTQGNLVKILQQPNNNTESMTAQLSANSAFLKTNMKLYNQLANDAMRRL